MTSFERGNVFKETIPLDKSLNEQNHNTIGERGRKRKRESMTESNVHILKVM
jgi:hypothetical protein